MATVIDADVQLCSAVNTTRWQPTMVERWLNNSKLFVRTLPYLLTLYESKLCA